jgi:hypothetical protein
LKINSKETDGKGDIKDYKGRLRNQRRRFVAITVVDL